MNLDQNIKIFIQTNPQQELAAKVSKYSFNKFGFNNIELLKLNNVEILKKILVKNIIEMANLLNLIHLIFSHLHCFVFFHQN